MMRSMFSGVSGLKGHQTRMDVVGNNIANVNTTGFKASRVTFADMISQNLSGAAGPNGTVGGVNPKQVGLGMSVASTDLIYTNGSVQQTGKNTDVAISRGDGLFVVSRGDQKYYTRNGAFEFDAQGNLTIPSTGLYVQGYMAVGGEVTPSGENTTKIQIPAGKSMEASSTISASYTKNLNATTTGYDIANILVKYADGTSGTTNNYAPTEQGKLVLTMSTGKKIYLGDSAPAQTVGAATTGTNLYTSTITNVTATTTGHVDANLELDDNNSSSPKKLTIGGTDYGTTANPIVRTGTTSLTTGTYAYGDAFNISGKITAVRSIASSSDVELDLGTDNTIQPGSAVTVTVPKPTSFTYKVDDTYTGQMKITSLTPQTGATVTTADGNSAVLAAAMGTAITSSVATYQHDGGSANEGTITAITRESTYVYGGKTVSSISLNTKTGTAISGLIGKTYNRNDTFYPSVTTLVTVYDSLGASHSIPVVFTKADNNKWTMSLGTGGDTYSIAEKDGSSTSVTLTKSDLLFDTTGGYLSGTAALNLTYGNGAAAQQVSMNLAAITQYAGTSTISATSDGNAAGTLSSVSIDSTGVITGTYTNNVRRTEAQIAMAQFNNPSGLTKMGGNLYQESNNTGTRTISGAADIGSELTTSALEMSNVDIADQFSDMIITQRGFQSNSKIITVSDEMLETLINMKR